MASKAPILQHLLQITYLTGQAEPAPPEVHSNDGNTSTQSSTSLSVSGDTAPSRQFDLLCLSLGLLETLLDNVEAARTACRAIQLSQSSGVTCIAKVFVDLQSQTEQAEKQILSKLCFLVLLHAMLGHAATQYDIGKALRADRTAAASFLQELKGLQVSRTDVDAEQAADDTQAELAAAVARLEGIGG